MPSPALISNFFSRLPSSFSSATLVLLPQSLVWKNSLYYTHLTFWNRQQFWCFLHNCIIIWLLFLIFQLEHNKNAFQKKNHIVCFFEAELIIKETQRQNIHFITQWQLKWLKVIIKSYLLEKMISWNCVFSVIGMCIQFSWKEQKDHRDRKEWGAQSTVTVTYREFYYFCQHRCHL